MTQPFTVIILRPDWFLYEVEDFDDMHDMQYVAKVRAENYLEAAKLRRAEVFDLDKRDFQRGRKGPADGKYDLNELQESAYTVLGVFAGHDGYEPIWSRLK